MDAGVEAAATANPGGAARAAARAESAVESDVLGIPEILVAAGSARPVAPLELAAVAELGDAAAAGSELPEAAEGALCAAIEAVAPMTGVVSRTASGRSDVVGRGGRDS